METYLIVMVTILAFTQIVRVVQNTIHLYTYSKKIKKHDDVIMDMWSTVTEAANKYLNK